MQPLEYSDEAINTLNTFHRADWVVYVEGDDDVLFWDGVFRKIGEAKIHVEDVGGREEVEKYAERVRSGRLNVIVAMDADYSLVLGHVEQSKRVIYTFGYSIENTIYSEKTITHIARTWCKDPKFDRATTAAWLESVAASLHRVLVLDLANESEGTGIRVLGDNCTHLMKSKRSCQVSPDIVANHCDSIERQISAPAIESARALLDDCGRGVLAILRGHFLASAIVKFVTSQMRSRRRNHGIGYDALYASGIQSFDANFSESHSEFEHYREAVANALA
jgi:uncharacterized protein DUF4435